MAAAIDITARVERHAESEARRAELARRDRDHGGLVPSDRETEAKRRATAAWLRPYRADVTRAEVAAARDRPLADFRTISAGRLALDVRRTVSRWTSARGDDAEAISARALAILLAWPDHGSAPTAEHPRAERMDLGGQLADGIARRMAATESTAARRALRYVSEAERIARAGTLPMRRDWLDASRRDREGAPMLTRGALRALHAAVKQATADLAAELRRADEPLGDALDITAAIEAQRIGADVPARLPETIDAPETIARHLDITLDAARAILARAYPSSIDQLAEQWGMSSASLSVALSRGRAAVLKRWPDPSDLLDDLDALAAMVRAEHERAAVLALLALRDGAGDPTDAALAVADWRGASRGLDDQTRAELAAARCALRRAGAGYHSARAERIASSSRRLLDAERARMRRRGQLPRTGATADTYPDPAPRRPKLTPSALRTLAAKREELARLLDGGSANADRIATLRAELSRVMSAPAEAEHRGQVARASAAVL